MNGYTKVDSGTTFGYKETKVQQLQVTRNLLLELQHVLETFQEQFKVKNRLCVPIFKL